MKLNRFGAMLMTAAFLMVPPAVFADDDVKTGTVIRTGPDGKSVTTEHRWKKTDTGHTRETTHTGSGGKSVSSSHETVKTDDGYKRSSTYTDAQGRSATREATGKWDPETKTWNKEVEGTGRQGGNWRRSTELQQTDTGYTGTTQVTGPDGQTSTRRTTGNWDAETKTWRKDIETTGPQGKVRGRSVIRQRQ